MQRERPYGTTQVWLLEHIGEPDVRHSREQPYRRGKSPSPTVYRSEVSWRWRCNCFFECNGVGGTGTLWPCAKHEPSVRDQG
ncbi:MAG: hypothetical protein JWN27_2961 [Candidatus Eremiobacteraeota bacterium]|nr:hypothetical protein [Candidatus Eremiobacteraeota bacterium]